jgi:hypothetical protein
MAVLGKLGCTKAFQEHMALADSGIMTYKRKSGESPAAGPATATVLRETIQTQVWLQPQVPAIEY